MNKKLEKTYKDALALAEETKAYIEENLRTTCSNESNEDILNTIKAMGMITFLLTSIISFLMLSKAYENGEVPKEKVIESANALMEEISKAQGYKIEAPAVSGILNKLDILMLKVREIVVN